MWRQLLTEDPEEPPRVIQQGLQFGRDSPMNVSIELDNEARQTYALTVDGVCIARALPMAEANRVRLQALKGEVGKPRSG